MLGLIFFKKAALSLDHFLEPDGDGGGLVDGRGQLVQEPGVQLFVQGGSSCLPLNPTLLDDTIHALHGAHRGVQGGADGPGRNLGGLQIQDGFVF